MQIMFDPNCLKETTERLFPTSRHRSARVRKKLVKRLGGEFKKEPAIFRILDARTGLERFVAHPSYRAEIERQTRPT